MNKIEESKNREVALFLEGGGIRGSFTAGVLEVFEKANLQFPSITGCSAGAVNGLYFACGSCDVLFEVWTKYVPTRRFINVARFLQGGPLMDVADLVHSIVLTEMPPQWEKLTVDSLRVCTTNVNTGDSVKFNILSPSDTIFLEASAAIPVIYNRTIWVDGCGYVDGGLSLPIPRAEPNRRSVVILTRPRGFRKSPPGIFTSYAVRLLSHSKAITRLVSNQHKVYNKCLDQLFELEARGLAYIIAPENDLPVSRLSKSHQKIEASIKEGRRTGKGHLIQLQRWLREGDNDK